MLMTGGLKSCLSVYIVGKKKKKGALAPAHIRLSRKLTRCAAYRANIGFYRANENRIKSENRSGQRTATGEASSANRRCQCVIGTRSVSRDECESAARQWKKKKTNKLKRKRGPDEIVIIRERPWVGGRGNGKEKQ